MGRRLELNTLLKTLCDNVYFQPPENLRLEYPCIVYSRDRGVTEFAGNLPYRYEQKYQVSFISREPDDTVQEQLRLLEKCVHVRFFTANQLNHDVFSLFF